MNILNFALSWIKINNKKIIYENFYKDNLIVETEANSNLTLSDISVNCPSLINCK